MGSNKMGSQLHRTGLSRLFIACALHTDLLLTFLHRLPGNTEGSRLQIPNLIFGDATLNDFSRARLNRSITVARPVPWTQDKSYAAFL